MTPRHALLQSAGLDEEAIAEWLAAAPRGTTDFAHDRSHYAHFWKKSDDLVRRPAAQT